MAKNLNKKYFFATNQHMLMKKLLKKRYFIFKKQKKSTILRWKGKHTQNFYFKNKSTQHTMGKAHSTINSEKLNTSSDLLRALAHPLRLQILEFIDKNKAINVNKIYNTLKLEQSITSQHLRILRAVGLVNTIREGKFIHYEVDYDKVDLAMKAVGSFLTRVPRLVEAEAH
jgi:DNA-binding transcriptional ArsR family regulator